MSQASLSPISLDFLKKTIEKTPGEGRCEQHNTVLNDVPYTYNGMTVNTYGPCPDCDAERKAAIEEQAKQERMKQMKERFVRMGIPPRYTGNRLAQFRAPHKAQQDVLSVAKHFCSTDELDSLLLLGNVGTGKTLLGCAILTECTHDADGLWASSGLYTTASQLMRRIKMSWKKDATENEQEVFAKLTKPYLLVIDEIGVQFNSDTERCLLTEVINDRYNARQRTMLISNLTLQEFTQVVGDRIVDRLKENGKVLVFDWASRRGKSA